uniref:RAB31, member RAS onco family n=1 Tax=Ailuropoda melanoleuca TaxID=9646 RepID=G1LM22_AILME
MCTGTSIPGHGDEGDVGRARGIVGAAQPRRGWEGTIWESLSKREGFEQCLRGHFDKNGKDTGVGKSSIVCRFVQDHFDHNISPTIGASFMTKTVPCGNELHKFLIWDTAGQERFHSLAPMYYRGSAAAVIVYDITKQDSFHTLKKWVKELKEHGPENIVMAIAGNKCDLSDIREVPLKDAKEYAESIGAVVVETSAKNAINIEELFQGISRQIPPLDPHENGNNGAIKLGKQATQASRRCC